MPALRTGFLTAILPLLMLMPSLAHSQSLSAVWDPNPPADAITSYEICIGTSSLSCNFQLATVPASETSYTFAPNPGVLYRIAVRAINAAGAGPFSTEVAISIPGLTQPANQTSPVNVAISPFSLSASDPDGGTIQFTHSGLPFGLSLNQSTGIITGTPTSPGTFNVTVFVSDGGVTTSRSFVWTVNGGSGGDTTAPTLAITSHTPGQTLSASSITLAGTATDNGAGGSGIASVTVNGAAATGGTATGSNTANWNRAVTLAAGANSFTIAATDGLGNVRTSNITINRTGTDAAAPTVSITSHTSGQTVSSPTITLTGTATDSGAGGNGIATVTVNGIATGATASGNNTANWSRSITLAPGANTVTVFAMDGLGYFRTTPITIIYSTSPITGVTLTPSLASPRLTGTTVTFTAGATGESAPYSYKWWIFSSGAWTLARDWSTSPTFSWTPSAPGDYRIGIWVRGANTSADTNAVNFSIPYVVTSTSSSLFTATGISANLASPRNVGTTVTFTAGATGGTAPYSYRWWIFSGGRWTLARDWSTSPTFSWTPSASGYYEIGIWVRGANSTADSSAVSFTIPYSVTGSASTPGDALRIVNITTDVGGHGSVGQTVTATATATGGTAPYQFKWWAFDGSSWQMVRDWGSNMFTFTPMPEHVNPNIRLGVWARSAGSRDESGSVNFAIAFPITWY
jgi:hypothetical protein